MSEKSIKKSESPLVRETLEGLLLLLDPDRNRAGEKYEKIREKLIDLFSWKGCAWPEDLADKTIDRVMAKISSGEEIINANSCILAVSRYVLMEYWREKRKTPIPLDDVSANKHPAAQQSENDEEMEKERKFKCLERCMRDLRAQDREMMEQYYRGEKRERIENRTAMANRLGVSQNALTIKTHRIKLRLEKCVADCLERTRTI